MPEPTRDLETNYADAFHGRLELGSRPVLLVVDVCRAYVEPTSPLYAGVEDSVEVMKRVVASARAHGVPVLWTRLEYEPGGANGGTFYKKGPALPSFDRGNPLGAWVDGLEPAPGETVITKQYPSAFVGTDLAEKLHTDGVDTIVICGWSTSGCVRATAVDAVSREFVPVVVREGVGDRHPAPHDASLFDLQAKYAEVVPERQALDYFAEVSATD